jgi:hypothetical protein
MTRKSDESGGGSPASGGHAPISRREFVEAAAIAGAGLATLGMSAQAEAGESSRRTVTAEDPSNDQQTEGNAMSGDNSMADEIVKAKIRRALLSGPDSVTREGHGCGDGCSRQDDRVASGNEPVGVCSRQRKHHRSGGYVRGPHGNAVDTGLDGKQAETVEYRARAYLHAQWGYAAQLYRSV